MRYAIRLLAIIALLPAAQAWGLGCSPYIGRATLNEYEQHNQSCTSDMRTFVEIKLLDESLRTSGVYKDWTLAICAGYPTTNAGGRNKECITGNADWYNANSTRADYYANLNYGSTWVVDPEPDNPWVPLGSIPSCYVDLNSGNNHGMETLLLDENGDVIDYFSVDGYDSIGEPGCSYDFDTTYAGGNNFNLQRIPDGTGSWDGTGSGGSGTDSNDETNDPLPDPPPGETYLWARIDDITVAAGSPAGFTISLYDDTGTAATFSQDITLTYSTLDGAATAGSDYTAASGNVTIPANSASAAVADITTFATAAPDEDFYVQLETVSSSNANIADHYGMALFTAPAIDHYELSLTASSINCLPSTVTVTACADGSSPCTDPYAGVGGETATLSTSAGSLAATTVTFDAGGIATTQLSYPNALEGATASVTLSGEQSAAGNPHQCCPEGASCSESDTCSTTFSKAGLIFADAPGGGEATLPTQEAGTASDTFYLRAVKTSDETAACEAALVGTNTVEFGYECGNPVACYAADRMSIVGSGPAALAARNDTGSVADYAAVDLTFDGNGNAPFTLTYTDVGQVALHARKTVNGALLAGASNAFVVKPHRFVLSNIRCTTADADHCGAGALALGGDNPAAADATGPAFIPAGEPFSVTVTAKDALGNTTPSYGRELVAEGVTLTNTLVGGLGLTENPDLNNAAGFGPFTDGVATGSAFSWDEVGIITLTPAVKDGDYLGTGDISGTASGQVGRFTPKNFAVTHWHWPANDDATGPADFTYAGGPAKPGQPFAVSGTVTARNVAGMTTKNYRGDFARLGVGGIGAAPLEAGAAAVGTLTWAVDSLSFTDGVGAFDEDDASYAFVAEGGPQTLYLRVTATDADGVIGSEEDDTKSVEYRFGRLRLTNAHGSELQALPVPFQAEYYHAGGYFTRNDWDVHTGLTLPTHLELSTDDGTTWSNTDTATIGSGTTTATLANSPLLSGDAGLSFGPPGAGNTGYVDLRGDLLADLPWLQYDWDGDGSAEDPSARATFGLYKGSDALIYRRELY